MKVKRIAILSCLKATDVCSGAACFKALNQRQKSFEVYAEDTIEVIGFFHCNGCECDYENDSAYIEKIDTMIGLKPDVIHVGKCTLIDGKECPVITRIVSTFEKNEILVVKGTH